MNKLSFGNIGPMAARVGQIIAYALGSCTCATIEPKCSRHQRQSALVCARSVREVYARNFVREG